MVLSDFSSIFFGIHLAGNAYVHAKCGQGIVRTARGQLRTRFRSNNLGDLAPVTLYNTHSRRL